MVNKPAPSKPINNQSGSTGNTSNKSESLNIYLQLINAQENEQTRTSTIM